MNRKLIAKKIILLAKEIISSDESWGRVKNSLEKELKKNFKQVTEKNENFWFEYKDCKCYVGYNGGMKPYYFMTGTDNKKRIDIAFMSDKDIQKLIQDFKKMIDVRLNADPNVKTLKNSILKHLKSWRIVKVSKTPQGLKAEICKKAYGDGYDVFCQVKNGKIYDSDSRGFIISETEKIIKETGIKDFIITGYAD